MKGHTLILAAAVVMVSPASTWARQSHEQAAQACESDVYSLCGKAIPDQQRITACLRKHWSKVSNKCRSAMANYGRNQSGKYSHHSRLHAITGY